MKKLLIIESLFCGCSLFENDDNCVLRKPYVGLRCNENVLNIEQCIDKDLGSYIYHSYITESFSDFYNESSTPCEPH